MWTPYVSNEKIQYESFVHGFRIVGTRAKAENVYAMAFEVGPKVSIEYMNSFIGEEDKKMLNYYKSNLSLADAKEKYPKWYQRRIENKEEKLHYSRHPGIYYNWIKKIKKGATVRHRYYCLEALCALGVQCNINPEQVEKDCRELMQIFEKLTIKEDNHFTEYDVICALSTYYKAEQSAYERNIDVISDKTGIPLKRAKRNGRTQKDHLKIARSARDTDNKNWRAGNGRKPKKDVVKQWRELHPDGKKADCISDTGLSKPTVYKWWN